MDYPWLLGDDSGGPDLIAELFDVGSGKRLRVALVHALGRGQDDRSPTWDWPDDTNIAAVGLLAMCAENDRDPDERIRELIGEMGRWPAAEREVARAAALEVVAAVNSPAGELAARFRESGDATFAGFQAELTSARAALESWGSRQRRTPSLPSEPFPIDVKVGTVIRADYENHSRTFLHVLGIRTDGFVCSVYPAGPDPLRLPLGALPELELWREHVDTAKPVLETPGLMSCTVVGVIKPPFPEGSAGVWRLSRNRQVFLVGAERLSMEDFEARFPEVDHRKLPPRKEAFSDLLGRAGRFGQPGNSSGKVRQLIVDTRGEHHAGQLQEDLRSSGLLRRLGVCFAWIAERPEGLRLIVPWVESGFRSPYRDPPTRSEHRAAVIAFVEQRGGDILDEETFELTGPPPGSTAPSPMNPRP